MAIKKRYVVSVEIDYYETDENGKEDDDKWIDSSYFKTEKPAGKDLYVMSFRPNVAHDAMLDQIKAMSVVMEESLEKLKQYERPEKVFGVFYEGKPRKFIRMEKEPNHG